MINIIIDEKIKTNINNDRFLFDYFRGKILDATDVVIDISNQSEQVKKGIRVFADKLQHRFDFHFKREINITVTDETEQEPSAQTPKLETNEVFFDELVNDQPIETITVEETTMSKKKKR